MTEIWNILFAPANIVYTILLALAFLYWITVIIGALDLTSFDFDLDIDADVDIDVDIDADVDVDADADVEGGGGANFILSMLAFFNIGKIPFMLYYSFLALFLWISAVLGNAYFSENIPYFAWVWALPSLLINLTITKFVTNPLVPIFKEQDAEFEKNSQVVGKVAIAVLPIDENSVSQIKLSTQTGAPLLLMAQTSEGQSIAKGDKALIVGFDKAKKVFMVEPFQV